MRASASSRSGIRSITAKRLFQGTAQDELRLKTWTKLIAEFDGRTFNIGAIVSLWRDHFDAMIEQQAMKWVTAGGRDKVVVRH